MNTSEEELNMDFNSFIRSLFLNPSMPPFSFRLEFMENMTGPGLTTLLSSILVSGASIRFGKQLHETTEREMQSIKEYMLSIGWNVDCHLAILDREVLDYHPDGVPYILLQKLNNWQVTFNMANPALNRYNDHYHP